MNEWIRTESRMEERGIESRSVDRVKHEAWSRGKGDRQAWREDGSGNL